MRLVLDASVAIKTVLAESDSDIAHTLIDGYIEGIHDLISPDIFPVEIAHGLTKAERRGLTKDAPQKIADVMANSPILHPHIPLLGRAVEIARQARISVYDCLYAALSEQEGCDLITADHRLKKNLPNFSIVTLDDPDLFRDLAG